MHRDTDQKRWVMIIKDSRNADLKTMPGRNLRLSFTGLDLHRPAFSPVSAPIAGDNAPIFADAEELHGGRAQPDSVPGAMVALLG